MCAPVMNYDRVLKRFLVRPQVNVLASIPKRNFPCNYIPSLLVLYFYFISFTLGKTQVNNCDFAHLKVIVDKGNGIS